MQNEQNLVRKVYKHLFVVWFNVPLMGGIEERRRTFDCELNYVAHQLEKFSLCTRIFRGKEFPINSIFLRLKFKQLNEVLARRQLAKENYQAEIILSIKQISSVLK